MKIYINEKEIETDRKYLWKLDFLTLNGDQSLCPPCEKYNVVLEISDKYWEDKDINDRGFEISEGMRFKVFPKASRSNYGD